MRKRTCAAWLEDLRRLAGGPAPLGWGICAARILARGCRSCLWGAGDGVSCTVCRAGLFLCRSGTGGRRPTEGIAAPQRKGNLPLLPWGCRGMVCPARRAVLDCFYAGGHRNSPGTGFRHRCKTLEKRSSVFFRSRTIQNAAQGSRGESSRQRDPDLVLSPCPVIIIITALRPCGNA